MAENDHIETLEFIHGLQNHASRAIDMLNTKVENATDITVECRVDGLELLKDLIETQSQVIRAYVEHESRLIDAIEVATETLKK